MFCAGPNFLTQPKNLTAFIASSKTFVIAQKPILLNANHFLSGTKCLWLAQYVNKFLVWHKWNLNYTTLILLQNKNDNGDGYAMEPLVEKYVKFFRSILHRNNYYFAKFVCCEGLNLVMLYANFYLTDVFINGNFWYYGYEVYQFSKLPRAEQVTLMWQFWPSFDLS